MRKSKKRKGWIIGNIIVFDEKPKYDSPFFGHQEVEIYFVKKVKKNKKS